MKKAYENVTLSGKRLKQEAKNRKIKNSQMADLLNYENEKSISAIYGGRQRLTQEKIDILVKEWGIRENYIKGIDDWRTVEDMEESVKASNIREYNIIRSYLETIGLSLLPTVYWICNPRELYFEYWNMEKYISDNGKKYANSIITIPLSPQSDNFDQEQFEDNGHKYSDGNYNIYIELKSNPKDGMKNINEMTKKDGTEEFELYWNYTDDNLQIEILYNVLFNGKSIGIVEVDQIKAFFNHIDLMCKTSIQTVLFNMVNNYKFENDIYD